MYSDQAGKAYITPPERLALQLPPRRAAQDDFKIATISRAEGGQLHPTITAGRDSPPDDRPPSYPNLLCGGGLSSPWAGWAGRRAAGLTGHPATK